MNRLIRNIGLQKKLSKLITANHISRENSGFVEKHVDDYLNNISDKKEINPKYSAKTIIKNFYLLFC